MEGSVIITLNDYDSLKGQASAYKGELEKWNDVLEKLNNNPELLLERIKLTIGTPAARMGDELFKLYKESNG